MTDGNGHMDRGMLPQEITDEHMRARGLLVDGLVGKLVLRRDLMLRRVASVDQTLKIDPKRYQEACGQAQQAVMQAVGYEMIRYMAGMPQARLLPVPFPVKSLRHEGDIGVQFWDFVPGPGSWMGGMKWLPGEGRYRYADLTEVAKAVKEGIHAHCEAERARFERDGGVLAPKPDDWPPNEPYHAVDSNPHALPDIGTLCSACSRLQERLILAIQAVGNPTAPPQTG